MFLFFIFKRLFGESERDIFETMDEDQPQKEC